MALSLELSLVNKATQAVYENLAKAELVYKCKFPVGDILFNLRGRAAGQVRYSIHGPNRLLPEMRFNYALFSENIDDFIHEVIPHECAHLVVYHLYSLKRFTFKARPKPHGKEWQAVMQNIYGLPPRVTHSFNVKSNQSKRFEYFCGCLDKVHALSIIRHNKVRREAANYLCRTCGQALEYQSEKYFQ